MNLVKVISEEDIRRRTAELGKQISADYQDSIMVSLRVPSRHSIAAGSSLKSR